MHHTLLHLQNRLSHLHNVLRQVEEHMVDGEKKRLLVHRKGSTRAFPPHHPLIPVDYQLTGQPVLIGGTMGTNSYVLTGVTPPQGHVQLHSVGQFLITPLGTCAGACTDHL